MATHGQVGRRPRSYTAFLMRRLRPLRHVSMNLLVGMERVELSCSKALVSKTSVSPISTTSPLTNSPVITHTLSNQALILYLLANLLTRLRQSKSPSIFRGAFTVPSELYLNQPHPSISGKSLRLSVRYELDKFFTESRIPHIMKKRTNSLVTPGSN